MPERSSRFSFLSDDLRGSGRPYRVFGYKGKQVRDNIHSFDLVEAFAEFVRAPRAGEVYNIGGSRHSNCSMLEAIELCEANQRQKIKLELRGNQSHRRSHLVDQRRAKVPIPLSAHGNFATASARKSLEEIYADLRRFGRRARAALQCQKQIRLLTLCACGEQPVAAHDVIDL